MGFDANKPGLIAGIVGTGVMGRGIAQVAAEGGMTVLLADARLEAVAEAQKFCADMIGRKAAKGQIPEAQAQQVIARIQTTPAGPDAGYASFAECDLVIEAVAERMDVKHAVLAGLEAVVRDECIIATNTSSLSVTGFAAKARLPGRVGGFHFFNPVPLMRLVEVVGGVLTKPWVLEALDTIAGRMGREPVRTADTPGFLVNHAGRAFGTEALRIVSEGICGFADVDRVMTEAAGFRLGPFELLDLTGLDVSHAVMESIYHQYYEEPRYRPVYIAAQRRAAGLFGRKMGRGFYDYPSGKAAKPPDPAAPQVDLSELTVWISRRQSEHVAALTRVVTDAGARLAEGALPPPDALLLVAPLGEDTTTAALTEKLDPARTVAVDCLFGLEGRRTLMRSPATDPRMLETAHAVLAANGNPVTVIRDSPGFIGQRIVAGIVNVGCDIAQQRIAAPEDINRAVELGLGYPCGPLKFGDDLGPGRILRILEAMQAFYGDPRYRASPWLKRRALLGLPLTTPE
jgi:3-hydroxybutyryl-CoA dehydrogenase